MSEQSRPRPLDLPTMDQWRDEWVEAALAYADERERKAPWWRRFLTPFVILLVVASGGYATARIVDYVGTDPELPPFKGEAHGFVDLETGEAIHCPDGSRLISVPLTGDEIPPRLRKWNDYVYPQYPTCPDGSVPRVYREQYHALLDYLNSPEAWGKKFGNPDEPRFEFEIPDDGGEEIPPADEYVAPGEQAP